MSGEDGVHSVHQDPHCSQQQHQDYAGSYIHDMQNISPILSLSMSLSYESPMQGLVSITFFSFTLLLVTYPLSILV